MQTVKRRVIPAVAVTILVIGVSLSVYLYSYLSAITKEKALSLDRMYLGEAALHIERYFGECMSMAFIAASDPSVISLAARQSRGGADWNSVQVNMQTKLNAWLHTNMASDYVDKFLLFDERGLCVQASITRLSGAFDDIDIIRALDSYKRLVRSSAGWAQSFNHSISADNPYDVYSLLVKTNWPHIDENISSVERGTGYIYVELGLDLVGFSLRPGMSVETNEGFFINSAGKLSKNDDVFHDEEGSAALVEVESADIENVPLVIRNHVDRSVFRPGQPQVLVVASLVALATLAAALSATYAFRKMEKTADEKRKVEIAYLQTQINPHFLYNTLDSIKWMAKIQHNDAIANLTGSLINLLRSIISKTKKDGPYTVEDELQLLTDYAALMSVRYMGAFELKINVDEEFFHCRIPKPTLQPLVENSIIHGLDGLERNCVITLSAERKTLEVNTGKGRKEPIDFLVLTVEDNGVGMDTKEISDLLKREHGKSGSSLNNIGVANVSERIKLQYGTGAGLFYESEKGQWTRATVRIPWEET